MMFMLLSVNFLYAQDSLKAVQGKFSTELNVNPFEGELSFNNAINQIKFRYFLSNQYALRLAINTDFKKNSNDEEMVYGTSPYNSEMTQKSGLIGINVGFEKHFTGTNRLSPYIGAEVFYADKSASQKDKASVNSQNIEREIKGAWFGYHQIIDPWGDPVLVNNYSERGFSQFGLNLLAGFDFYIAKNFYFGYEMAFGYSSLKHKDIEVTITPENDNDNLRPETDSKEMAFGAKLLNGIRLGFIF